MKHEIDAERLTTGGDDGTRTALINAEASGEKADRASGGACPLGATCLNDQPREKCSNAVTQTTETRVSRGPSEPLGPPAHCASSREELCEREIGTGDEGEL